jgi:hypothetical protein
MPRTTIAKPTRRMYVVVHPGVSCCCGTELEKARVRRVLATQLVHLPNHGVAP